MKESMIRNWLGHVTAVYALLCPIIAWFWFILLASFGQWVGNGIAPPAYFYILVPIPLLFCGYLGVHAIVLSNQLNDIWMKLEGIFAVVVALPLLVYLPIAIGLMSSG